MGRKKKQIEAPVEQYADVTQVADMEAQEIASAYGDTGEPADQISVVFDEDGNERYFTADGHEVYFDDNGVMYYVEPEAQPEAQPADYGDGVDTSDLLPEDDGYNAYRTIVSQDVLQQYDMDVLAEHLLIISEAKKALTEQYEERKRMMTRQIDAIEKSLTEIMKKKKMPKASFTFEVDGEAVALGLTPSSKTHYAVADWEAFYAWVYENYALDAIQKRVSEKALESYMEVLAQQVADGERTAEEAVIPGITRNTFPVLSVTTRRAKPKSQP